MEYKISIIIPIFNVEAYIKIALESIVRQTIGFKNLEVIMVDDCSTDKSGEIMAEYASKYDNFKAIYLPENSGAAGKPRNIGISSACGDYLMFLDPDDYYKDDACEILYNKIVEEDVDIVFGRYYVLKEKRLNGKSFSPFEDNEIKLKSINDDKKLFTTAPSIWTKIVKRSFIEKNNITFLEGIPGQDAVFVVDMFLKAEGIIYLNNYFPYNYTIRDSEGNLSISNNNSKKNLMGLIKAYYGIFDILKENNKEGYFVTIFRGHLQFWVHRFLISNIKHDEKMELLENAHPLFEKFGEYGINPEEEYLIPLFDYISAKDYDKAILIADVLNGVITDRQILQKNYFRLDQDYATLKERNNQLEQDYIALKKRNNQLEKNNSILSRQNAKFIDQIDIKKKRVAELQTTFGWIKYKAKNIGQRLKGKLTYFFSFSQEQG